MKAPRIPDEAGYCTPSRLPRGPNGNPLCRRCQTECPGKRNTFCSDACVHEWRLRTDPGYQARHVLERDNGICESCGLDCLALMGELKALRTADRRVRRMGVLDSRSFSFEIRDTDGSFGARCAQLGLPKHLRFLDRRIWEMDHRVPVAEGGGSCGIENLRTLCAMCHRRETAELRARLKRNRARAKHNEVTSAMAGPSVERESAVARSDTANDGLGHSDHDGKVRLDADR